MSGKASIAKLNYSGGIQIVKTTGDNKDSASTSDDPDRSTLIEIVKVETPQGTLLQTAAEELVTCDEQDLIGNSCEDVALNCPYCPEVGFDKDELEEHMPMCEIIRRHACDQCCKRFRCRGSLNAHQRTHLPNRLRLRPYPCTHCDKTFTHTSSRDIHQRIHTGSKPFLCDYCSKDFRSSQEQIRHEYRKHKKHSTS